MRNMVFEVRVLAYVLVALCISGMASSVGLYEVSPVGPKMCCLICKRRGNCEKTTYDPKRLICDVTDSKKSGDESMGEFCKGDNNQDVCTKTRCPDVEECLTTSSKQARCVPSTKPKTTSVCGETPSLGNGSVGYTSRPKSKVRYSCFKDFRFFGRIRWSKCLENGSWYGPTGFCGRVAFYDASLPFKGIIPEAITTGWMVQILGAPLKQPNMMIDLVFSDIYVALRMEVFMASGKAELTGFSKKGYFPQDTIQPDVPFTVAKPFNLTIEATSTGFKIYVDGTVFAFRKHHVDIALIDCVAVVAGVVLESVKFRY